MRLDEITAKVSVAHVTDNGVTEQMRMHAISGAKPEENNFHEGIAAPPLVIDMTVSSAAAKGFFKPGKVYTVCFTPVDAADNAKF